LGGKLLYKRARVIANEIKKYDEIMIISHIDADGISAAGIASSSLMREGIEHRVQFVKQLDSAVIKNLKNENKMVWFTDLGSGNLHELQDLNAVITDHHVPSQKGIALKDRKDLLTLYNAVETNSLHLNPHLFGRDGARDISGAGTAYLVAKALNRKNIDLSALAIVGAVGDLQSIENRRLIGTNRDILNDGKKAGVLSWKIDIQFFGRETRPVFKLLQYANDPLIPKLTGNKENCIDFLLGLGIDLKEGEEWRKWVDLTKTERGRIISAIITILLKKGFGHALAERVLGEVYILQKEEGALRAAKEFATLLNSCGRYEKADIGYQICLGDRDEWLKKAESLLLGHRKTLVNSLQFIKEIGITEKRYIQYFHGKDEILDSVIGITASMLLGSGEINQKLPIFAFANTKEGIKVSARSTRSLISKGLDLSIVMKEASKQVGGHGGGHNIAAGATIPYGTEEEFLDTSEEIIRKQLGK